MKKTLFSHTSKHFRKSALLASLFFLTLVSWGISSPINTAPDEFYHIGEIWCNNVDVSKCNLIEQESDQQSTDLAASGKFLLNLCPPAREDWNIAKGNYPLVALESNACRTANGEFTKKFGSADISYHKILAKFINNDSARSIINLRVVNSLFASCLFFLFYFTANNRVSKPVILSILFTLIPQGLFTGSSLNPSSWSYFGVTFSWAFLYSIIVSRNNPMAHTALSLFGFLVSSVMVLSSRMDGRLYLVLSFLTIILISEKFRFSGIYKKIVFTISFLLILENVRDNIHIIQPLRESIQNFSTLSDLILLIGNSFKVTVAIPLRLFGLEATGWLGINVPKIVVLTNLAALTMTYCYAYDKKNLRQKRLTLLILFEFFVIVFFANLIYPIWTAPFYLIRTGWSGDYFQTRYFLPVLPLCFAMFLMSSNKPYLNTRPQKFVFILLLSVGHLLSLYSVGYYFRNNKSWWWTDLVVNQSFVFAIGNVSFVGFLLIFLNVFGYETSLVCQRSKKYKWSLPRTKRQ
jgi:hypothetical protein